MDDTLLSIRNLRLGVKQKHLRLKQKVKKQTPPASPRILVDIDELSIRKGEIFALVGETGSGKSLTAASCLRLYPSKAINVLSGSIMFEGQDILKLEKKEVTRLRGKEIAMIFQDPMSALNPVFRVGTLINEVIHAHFSLSAQDAHVHALTALENAGIHHGEEILRRYPHQLSGGQRQRICIAMALSCEPKLLIADEPTTALDVTIQAQILRLIVSLCRERSLSILFITHNLGVVAQIANRVAVMRDGRIVERGTTAEVLGAPSHPYTKSLIDALPR